MDKSQNCGSCTFYAPGAKKNEGACRRYPPKEFLLGMRPAERPGEAPTPIHISLFPGVGAGVFCGEYRSKDAS